MNKFIITTTMAVALITAGCSSRVNESGSSISPTSSRNTSDSNALKVAKAGGLIDLRDGKSPSTYMQSGAYSAASTISSAMSSGNILAGAGYGFITSVLTPASPSTYSNLFIWIPVSEASTKEKATTQVLNDMEKGFIQTLNSKGVQAKSLHTIDKYGHRISFGTDPSKFSIMNTGVYNKTVIRKEAHPLTGIPSWRFSKVTIGIPPFNNEIGKKTVNNTNFYQTLSTNMRHTYVYAPARIMIGNTGKFTTMPVIYKSGKAMYFLK